MKTYLVGGAVRDMLLGLEPKDRDFVVVGSSPEEMLALGYQQVGVGFPVFLHPVTGEEYALARTERKSGVGYNGFTVDANPHVTLEEDLSRRDLTINAMAMDIDTMDVIDPYGGIRDLRAHVLRATSDAFAEDPIRVLRTARFAARYGYTIDPATVEMMHYIVPEIDAVPAERVYAEFEKGLMEAHPYKMYDALRSCGAERSKRVAPFLKMWLKSVWHRMPQSIGVNIRMAMACNFFSEDQLRDACVPKSIAKLALLASSVLDQMLMLAHGHLSAEETVRVLEKCRAFSNPVMLWDVVTMLELYTDNWQRDTWLRNYVKVALAVSLTVDAEAIAANASMPSQIGQCIHAARVEALERFRSQMKDA